jgi:oligosaccharyl transferase (archaeosortase A-associated)
MNKISLNSLITFLLAAFFSLSLMIRTILPFDRIFSGDWIKFSSIDAYYHMFLVDNLARNFPNITAFHPYFIYPDSASFAGARITEGVHFFNWLLGGIIWLVGLGSPTQNTVDAVSVYFPAILAALTVIPVFFIGKILFNKWVGIIAAALIAVLPGEFLGRSILGFTDQHVAETLFSAVAALFIILAVRRAGQNQLTLQSIVKGDWSVVLRPLIWSLLGGFFLGIYLITWQGGLLFVFIVGLFFVIQFIIDHLKGNSTEYLGIVGFIVFFLSMIIFVLTLWGSIFMSLSPLRDVALAMVGAVILPPVLALISRIIAGRNLKRYFYPVSLIAIGIIFLVILALVFPGLYDTVAERFTIFNPSGASAQTTIEMQSFLFPEGDFTTALAWGNFTTGFFLVPEVAVPGFGLIALAILIWLYVRHRARDNHWLFFIVWTIVILIATIGQRRFAYYLAVNMALLTAYISYQIIWWGGLRKLVNRSPGDKSPASGVSHYPLRFIGVIALAVIVLFSVFFWNIQKSVSVARAALYAPSDAWQESLLWMKDNTPEPFGDPEAYYALYEPPPSGEEFAYPGTAYGVTSWWDYGYWITRTAHRIPGANPSQDPEPIRQVAELLLSQEWPPTPETLDILDHLKTRYFVIDFAMTRSKFHALANWAGTSVENYFDVYLIPTENGYQPKHFYYPQYYRTLGVRLFHFQGREVNEKSPMVIEYQYVDFEDAGEYKVLTKISTFNTYEEARDYLETTAPENSRIVGIFPFISPVSLEAMEGISMVYTSGGETVFTDSEPPDWETIAIRLPEVRIFEYEEIYHDAVAGNLQ